MQSFARKEDDKMFSMGGMIFTTDKEDFHSECDFYENDIKRIIKVVDKYPISFDNIADVTENLAELVDVCGGIDIIMNLISKEKKLRGI